MSSVEKIIKDMAIGKPILAVFFSLPKDALLEKLRSVLSGNNNCLEVVNENPTVIKTIRDDEPTEIKISSWSTIEIDTLGILYKPEHGSYARVLSFNEHFKL